jgi:hypothetical protein
MSKQTAQSEIQAADSDAAQGQRAKTGCCGGAPPPGADACCVLDADIKSSGGSSCGCNPRAATGARQKGGCC